MLRVFLTILLLALVVRVQAQVRFGDRFKPKDEKLELNYTNPKTYEIAEIKVIGSEFLDENALISISGLKVGDKIKIPGEGITNAIKKLWKQGIIGDVAIYASKVEENKIFLSIELVERPRLSRVVIEGVNKTQQGDLDDNIKLIRGRVLTDALIKNAELTVRKYMWEKGFLNASVDITQSKDTLLSNSVQLRIVVSKGKKVKVDRITFYGNDNYSKGKLKSKLKSTGERPRFTLFQDIFLKIVRLAKPSNFLEFASNKKEMSKEDLMAYINDHVKLNVFKASKYDRTEFAEDRKNLVDFYNSKGYRDAQIITDSIYAVNDRSIHLDIKLSEGKKYYIRDISWTGNYIHTDETLDKIFAIEKGDVYDLELINKRLNFNPTGTDITSLYMDNGYLGFTVQPVEVTIEDDSIDLEMRIREGGIFTVNKVIIKGNDRTNDHVIRREIRTLPGAKFSRALLIRTNRELAQLGYFDPEQIQIDPFPNPVNNTVDIQYSLVEKPSDQVELSGGWGGSIGFVGTLGLVFNNFSVRNIPHVKNWRPLPVGDGQKLALRLQASGRRFQNYSVSFSEPWLGGKKPNSLSLNFTHSIQRTQSPFDSEGRPVGFLNRNEFNGSLKLTGVTIGLGRRVRWPDDNFVLSNSLSYLVYTLDNFSNSLGFRNGVSNSLTLTTTVARNSIDNPMFPRSGSSLSLSLILTPPYSAFSDKDYSTLSNAEKFNLVEYHKWMFDSKYYLNLFANLVLEARAHMGFIGAYTNKTGVGPFERFQMGGSGLTGQNFILGTEVIGLRGYEDNSIVPVEGTSTVEIDENGLLIGEDTRIQGGIVYNKFVMELRYPVSLNPAATIYLLAFAEGGSNYNDYSKFDPFNLYKSAGVGARVFMPAFGLLGIDWGYGFDTLPGRNTQSGGQIHFTIGQQIR